MRIVIAIFRLICLFFVNLFWFTVGMLLSPFLPREKYLHLVQLWAKSILVSIGAKVNIIGNSGNYIQSNNIVIANHISWLDIPIIYTTYAVSFVARAEIKDWPVLGRLMNTLGTLFIDRNKKRDILNVNQNVHKQLVEGGVIGLFPEGRTSDGKQVLPFRAPLLENAITTPNCQITPLVIEYKDKSGNRTHQVTYAGNITFYQTVKNTLLIDKLHINIYILPKVNANTFAKRSELSNFLYTLISSHYNASNITQNSNREEIANANINLPTINTNGIPEENLEILPLQITNNTK